MASSSSSSSSASRRHNDNAHHLAASSTSSSYSSAAAPRTRRTTTCRHSWSHALSLVTLALLALLALLARPAAAVSSGQQHPLKPIARPVYSVGQAVPVECLNRTVDTGEHITDASGQLQYVPFPVCNETGKPLELYFGVEQDLNCTIDFISDPLFHLLEFYIHNDAPLTCRVPSWPLPSSIISTPSKPSSDPSARRRSDHKDQNEYSVDALSGTDNGAMGAQSTAYTPLVIALTGTLQLSHLHVASTLNVLLHTAAATAPSSSKQIDVVNDKQILAAAAYSTTQRAPPPSRIVIGDALPLQFRVRWYDGPSPPLGSSSSSSSGGGGCCSPSAVLFYCALSAGAAVAVSFAWWRGVEMPRRIGRGGVGLGLGMGMGAREARLEGGFGAASLGKAAYSGYGYNGYGVGGGGGGIMNGGMGGKRD
ncbi:hypothetical protein IWZ00DRAFT_513229 [Phyllosticta capitalensis]